MVIFWVLEIFGSFFRFRKHFGHFLGFWGILVIFEFWGYFGHFRGFGGGGEYFAHFRIVGGIFLIFWVFGAF